MYSDVKRKLYYPIVSHLHDDGENERETVESNATTHTRKLLSDTVHVSFSSRFMLQVDCVISLNLLLLGEGKNGIGFISLCFLNQTLANNVGV